MDSCLASLPAHGLGYRGLWLSKAPAKAHQSLACSPQAWLRHGPGRPRPDSRACLAGLCRS